MIVLNEVHPWEGGLEELVPQHEEVVLEAVVMVLKVDVASFVKAHVEFCDALAVLCVSPSRYLDLRLVGILKLPESYKL